MNNMITKKLFVSKNSNDNDYITQAVKILAAGGIVAIPTETVYGLAANATDETAVKNIFKAKGRPQDNPLIVHISSLNMLYPLVKAFPNKAKKCAEAFWPGPFTIVLPKSDAIPKRVCAGLDTVALRMPSNKVALNIIKACKFPLAAPSANLSGLPSPTSAEHVLKDLNGRIDAIVFAEDSNIGLESTVVSFAVNPPRLLRPGGISVEQIKEILPNIVIDDAVVSQINKDIPVASPGMKYKHYSPKCNITIIDSDFDSFKAFVEEKKNVCALCFKGEEKKLSVPCITYGCIDDSSSQAFKLFNALRSLDDKNFAECFARCPNKKGIGLAVYNRLLRAASFKVIKI